MVLWINALQRTQIAPEAKALAYNHHLKDWVVHCSVTGEPIPVPELKYWNVDTQEVYKSAEVVPLDRHPEEPAKKETATEKPKHNG